MVDSIKKPNVIIDKSLEKYQAMVLFPEALAKANKMLENSKLPESLLKQIKESKNL